jgi:hypothetical protein
MVNKQEMAAKGGKLASPDSFIKVSSLIKFRIVDSKHHIWPQSVFKDFVGNFCLETLKLSAQNGFFKKTSLSVSSI